MIIQLIFRPKEFIDVDGDDDAKIRDKSDDMMPPSESSEDEEEHIE